MKSVYRELVLVFSLLLIGVVFAGLLHFKRVERDYRAEAAPNLRLPLTRAEAPAVKAILGQEGVVDSSNYRDVPVLAGLPAVLNSPWFLVAGMDQSEIAAPLRLHLWVLIGFIPLLLLIAAIVLGFSWRRQSLLHYRERFEAEEALRKQEERYHRTLDDMMEGCQIIGRDWRYLYVNPATSRYARMPKEALVGRTMMECFPGIEDTPLFRELRRCMDGRVFHQMENEFTYPDGASAWFELNIQPAPEGLFILAIDITQRKQAEERLRHLAEVLHAVRNVNQLITHEKDPAALLRRACEIMTETRGYRSAWIGRFDATGTLHGEAEAGVDDAFGAVRHQMESGNWPECCRRALDSDGVVVVHDVAMNCAQCPVSRGYRDTAALAHRLHHQSRDYGVLVVALPASLVGDIEEQSLFLEMAGDIGFALHAIEIEQERSRAERVLSESEALLREVGHIAQIGGWEMDLRTREARWTQTTYEIIGIEPNTPIPGPDEHLQYYLEEDRPKVAEAMRALIADGIPIEFEARAEIRGKGLRWFRVLGRSVREDGKCMLVCGTIQDITEGKRAEEAWLESEERFRTLVSGAPDGIFVQSDERFLFLNPAMVAMLGAKDAGDLLGADLMERVAPEFREAVRERARMQRETGLAAPPSEQEYLRVDGRRVPVETTAVAVQYRGGDAHLVFVRDITERKKVEEDLRKLSAAVTQSPVVVVITDLNGNIEYVNPRFTETTGYTREEVAGKNPRVLKSGEMSLDNYRILWETVSAGGEWRGEFHNKRKDGSLYWERAFIAPIRDANGSITHYIAVKEEITQHKQLEAQYRQAQRMEAVGQLAGGVAHDFNNVLQAIVGYGSMLLEAFPEGGSTRDHINEILHAADRASTLTRQLLAFSRRQVLDIEDLDLNDVVQRIMKMIRRVIGESVEVTTVGAHPLSAIHADRGQMEQVILNLSVNARDAMPEGGTLLIETENAELDVAYCRAHPWATPGPYVLLSVTDSGCGMDAETQARIFEPFFTTKEPGKGTGLGLSTVYGIVKQHHGLINVYSEIGTGTTFKVYLPSSAEPVHIQETTVLPSPAGGSETILVAEDDEPLRKLAAQILEGAGYRVFVAADGQEAIEVFQRHAQEIALVMLDVVMPKMGGKGVYDALRETHPHVKFLFSSGYGTSAIHTNFVLKDGIELVRKPYAPNALLTKVREVLDGRP